MRVLVWHVHGGWMDAFLRGRHDYLVLARGGEPRRELPPGARWVEPAELSQEHIDVVVLQRIEEIDLVESLTGRSPGHDLEAVYVEHNTPKQRPVTERHPLAAQKRIPIVHVTHFNRLIWDCGEARTAVIEHGIPDPGLQYTGELESFGAVINEPVRRGRVTGTDLLPRFAEVAPVDCFGIDSELLVATHTRQANRIRPQGDLATKVLHRELSRRRAYVHPMRWTSLGLSLLEAMSLGMPVLVIAATEAPRAVPPGAGAVSADLDELLATGRRLLAEPEAAREMGMAARSFARARYGLERFLGDWDEMLEHHAREGVST